MPIMDNNKTYDTKQSTNLRIDPILKEKLIKECNDKSTTMSDLINAILKKRYKE